MKNRMDVKNKWFSFAEGAKILKRDGIFDEVYLTQAYPGNPQKFYGCLRASMFRSYGKITVPLSPVIMLKQSEIERVIEFATTRGIDKFKNVILFEHSPDSGQSWVTDEMARKIAREILDGNPHTCIIFTGNKPSQFALQNCFDASELTFRENAVLAKYCTMLIGTGSGVTQLCHELPMVQLLKSIQ